MGVRARLANPQLGSVRNVESGCLPMPRGLSYFVKEGASLPGTFSAGGAGRAAAVHERERVPLADE